MELLIGLRGKCVVRRSNSEPLHSRGTVEPTKSLQVKPQQFSLSEKDFVCCRIDQMLININICVRLSLYQVLVVYKLLVG